MLPLFLAFVLFYNNLIDILYLRYNISNEKIYIFSRNFNSYKFINM